MVSTIGNHPGYADVYGIVLPDDRRLLDFQPGRMSKVGSHLTALRLLGSGRNICAVLPTGQKRLSCLRLG